MNKIIEYINKIEFDMSIKFSPVYKRFLIEEIKDSETYEITNKKHENYICITILILLKEMKHMIFNKWSLTIF